MQCQKEAGVGHERDGKTLQAWAEAGSLVAKEFPFDGKEVHIRKVVTG
jgi:hypothetical protein